MFTEPPIVTVIVVTYDNREVYVEVSPCSWMYPGYGLQIKMATKPSAVNAESVFDCDKSVEVDEFMSQDELYKLAQRQAIAWLEKNGVEILDQKVLEWSKTHAVLAERVKQTHEKEKQDYVKRMTAHVKAGYTHVLRAWIHPSRGDDYQVEACFKGKPTPKQIRATLGKSMVKTDYKLELIADTLK